MEHINLEIVKAQRVSTPEGEAIVKGLIEKHVELTGSAKGEQVLAKWEEYLPRFWQLVPPGGVCMRVADAGFRPSKGYRARCANTTWLSTNLAHTVRGFGSYFLNDFCASLPICLLYTSPSPRDKRQSRMPSSA